MIFHKAAANLTSCFRSRGYPKTMVAWAQEVARTSTREDLLQPKMQRNDSQIKIVTWYNNQWNDLYKVFNSNWHLLTLDPKISSYITERPQLVARRAPNVKDRLVKSHFTCPKSSNYSRRFRGTYPCGSCKHMPIYVIRTGIPQPKKW